MRRDWFVHVYERIRIYICAQLQPSLLTKGHVYNQKGQVIAAIASVNLINQCLPVKYSNEN